MNKDELIELAGNPNFISGIHNYCDRWCERCQFTSKCAVYASEKADPELDDPAVRDITNEKFWRKMHEIFQVTAEMISDWAAKNGVDLNSMDYEEAIAEHDREFEEARENALSEAAGAYSDSVEQWFKNDFVMSDLVDDITGASESLTDDIAAAEAVEVIRWYQFFIAAKTFRAVSGSKEFAGDAVEDEALSFDCSFDDDEDVNCDAVLTRSAKMDSHGSAKIALVAIDRSIAAWRALQISLPEKSNTIKPLLVGLDQLRRALEARFPRARDFIRPGFDETMTEFVS
jgi:hypothetical protein